jgi:hypothetical protein
LQSLFSQVNVSLNDKLVTPSATTYSYSAMIETLLNFGPAAMRSRMQTSLFFMDTAGKMDVHNPGALDANANMGLKKRHLYMRTYAFKNA